MLWSAYLIAGCTHAEVYKVGDQEKWSSILR